MKFFKNILTALVLVGLAAGSYRVPVGAQGVETNRNRLNNPVITGQALAADGTAAAPSYSFVNATGAGLYLTSTSPQTLGIAADGTLLARWDATNGLRSDTSGRFQTSLSVLGSAATFDLNGDVILIREAANTLAQRNGTNAQTFRVAKSMTAAGTGTWLQLTGNDGNGNAAIFSNWSSGAFAFGFGSGGVQWTVSTSGHLLAVTDNTYDIGASGATRPRTGYFGTAVSIAGKTGHPFGVNVGTNENVVINNISSKATIQSENDAGNALTDLRFRAGNFYWDSGNMLWVTDNTFDIGASGATRPRTGYFGTSIDIGTNPATSGAIRIANNAGLGGRNASNNANVSMIALSTVNTIDIGDATQAASINLANTVTKFNNVTTAGLGLPAIYSAPAQSATKTANFTVLSYTPPATAGQYEVSGVITTTSSTNTGTVQFTLDYVDSQGTTHTGDIIPLVDAAGSVATTKSGASKEYHALPWTFSINNSATAIALKVVVTGSVSYTVTGNVKQIQ